MRPLATALVLAASAILSLGCGQEEQALQPPATGTATPLTTSTPTIAPVVTPSPAAKGQLWRWVNVTVVIPEGSGVQPSPQDASSDLKPPSGGPALQLVREDTSAGTISSVLIDAETGSILLKEILEEHRAAIEEVLATLAVAPLDPATAPWPYTGSAPQTGTERLGNVQFIRPDPASGILMYSGISDSFGPSPMSLQFLQITNGRSTTAVDLRTGSRLKQNETIASPDEAAFEQLIASLKVCGREIQC